ncbi:hypothetical protein IU443_28500 [Nocardia farcinica]|uniref:hypothetical protein n=1 Tax=Nocardia farcinica TaxID=37329 RepID=UPI001894975B|nr:hypothetical protein [Nocardia farcinica]MBF6393873.1 hypothetical protein [Nocardia farcinica]
MSNIVAFIEARLAENEEAARKAADFPYDAPSDAPWVSMQLLVRRGVAMTSDIRAIAAIWSDHPDYQPEWALDPRAAETETGDPE